MNSNEIFTVNVCVYESLHYFYLRSKWCVYPHSVHAHMIKLNFDDPKWTSHSKTLTTEFFFSSFFSSIHYINGVLSQYLFTVKSITVKRTMTLAEVYFRTYTIHEVTKKYDVWVEAVLFPLKYSPEFWKEQRISFCLQKRGEWTSFELLHVFLMVYKISKWMQLKRCTLCRLLCIPEKRSPLSYNYFFSNTKSFIGMTISATVEILCKYNFWWHISINYYLINNP